MTLDELAPLLFPQRPHFAADAHGVFQAPATLKDGTAVQVAGIAGGVPVSLQVAITLAGHVLDHVAAAGKAPLVLLIDTASQNMTRHDELLGLNEYLAHLTKSLILAAEEGIRVVGILHGPAAAGAFIATGLASQTLVSVPGAAPSVMDLPSVARVTKLPLARLQEMANSTAIFAPGVDHLAATGAIAESWDDPSQFADRLVAVVHVVPASTDERGTLGKQRGGRAFSDDIARRIIQEADRLA